MNPADFQLLAALLRKRSGLMLTPDKGYLLESRLMPVARTHNFQDIVQLCAHLRGTPAESLLVEITEAMTTNESSFFRDIKPFDQFRQIMMPAVTSAMGANRLLRIWSAACSTGQEPYTLAMCLQEDAAKYTGWRFEIVASDLAQKVVNRAKEGKYTQFEAQRGLPIQMLLKYFNQLPDSNWQIKEAIRGMVQFRTFNLLGDFSAMGRFDIVFLRNVLIYFDEETKAQITQKLARVLPPHGLLVLGATETLVDPTGLFSAMPELRGAYKPKA